MTKPARNRIILKDVNDNISDHLRNHMHLTNCIHLKNHHMRSKQSPILVAANRSLMRDLAVLQRSTRSLRDPSTSPLQVRFGTSADENRLQDEFKDFIHGNGSGNSTHRSINVKNRRRRRKSDTTLDGSELSVASNSFGQCQNQDVSKNRCGIPWNWSRIHRSGKSFLDLAGKNLYCGFSESTRSRIHDDFSGELGIFAGNNLLNNDTDSVLVSEARFCGRCCSLGHNGNSLRHWSLTNKYMPMTFRGLVGQNLVVKALSNAVHKRKVGSLYAFYGPSGTGKTCCAQIFSRALNCKSCDHHSKPCGACSSCINNLNVREIGPVSNVDFEDIMDLLEMMSVSQYRVFIFDGCDNLATRSWNAILKFIDRAPRKVVFVLICSRLDALPHMIISRCQKFFFPKLRDVDMIRTLRRIAAQEEVEIDEDALKLVATRAYGSLRDGEMTLEQLSLLGQRVTVSLVQELVGLISDEKLVDLLDLALSADTVNTVRNLRGIIEAGVEPLALMSQLATVITDILAGSYDFSKDRSQRRKFFRRHALTKDDMEKLRQALKTLSEAEKQLRVSNDRVTWLTAALLQLAPDQQDQLLISSADTSFNQSPLGLFNYGGETELLKTENVQTGSSMSNYNDGTEKRGIIERKQHSIADIWMDVIKRINVTSLKEFLYQEGRLVLVRFGAGYLFHSLQLMIDTYISWTLKMHFCMVTLRKKSILSNLRDLLLRGSMVKFVDFANLFMV
ncbi:unnamed protein product [Cuscuta europaea]|uniref:AAA+ ATPase domain-containing protein n=1 Tax=Cuscuta europaea TaxID=41803 RepID=A0A9P0YHC9_CUSEU|nr:unnamed protein product [Cuscuta europaea]